jgi:hypothetical protein
LNQGRRRNGDQQGRRQAQKYTFPNGCEWIRHCSLLQGGVHSADINAKQMPRQARKFPLKALALIKYLDDLDWRR